MLEKLYILVPFIVAFVATLIIHPSILKIAIAKNIVDNPDARKLQRNPTPVLGGVAVFFGIVLGLCSSLVISENYIFIYAAAMFIMLYIGTIDDILGLSPKVRFLIEIGVVIMLMHVTKHNINDFFGLWDIHQIPQWAAYQLTILASVGIINAINLIDGVNGLSTGFSIMASTIFAIIFYLSGNYTMTTIAIAAAGGIIPFFLHNVFGSKTRMFIGDGGALLMGTAISIFIMNILYSDSTTAHFADNGAGLIAFCIAVLSVPVFDTLRVMFMRILRGTSPFNADKTHLHHLFIDLGFSHIGTTFSILSLNTLVIISWWIVYTLGGSIEVQLYTVLALSILITFVFYKFVRNQIAKENKICNFLKRIGKATHIEDKKMWGRVQKLVDKI